MYAGTKFNWYDQSGISEVVEQVELVNRPLFMAGITADKGTEDLVRLYGDDFYKMYGRNLSFAKHGQPLLQAGRIIDAGAELLVKRVVAEDATLSNIILVANVSESEDQQQDEDGNVLYTNPITGEQTTEASVQKVDENGAQLFVDPVTGEETTEATSQKVDGEGNVVYINAVTGEETTEAASQKVDENGAPLFIDPNTGDETTSADDGAGTTYLPVMIDNEVAMNNNEAVMVECTPITTVTGCNIKWEVQTIANCKKYSEVMEEAAVLFDEANGVYPMMVVTDIGRNADCKAIRIAPDYDISRSVGFMFYRASEFENTTSEENVTITMNPSIKYKNVSYAINEHSMGQLQLGVIDGVFDAYVAKLSEFTGIPVDEMKMLDVINGANCKGVALTGITIDPDSVNLSYDYGITLQSGSNGTAFGDAPFHSENYGTAIAKLFDGAYGDEVFDVDIHKICAICDANYPKEVKDSIQKFVDFREDCFFFRDLGLGLDTFDLIYTEAEKQMKSRFGANYMTSYQVLDPYTNKRIEVTSMYDLSACIVNHIVSGMASNPLAGEINGFVMENAIKGTINYVPRRTPSVDQKDLLDDARINYATYYEYEGDLVVDSLYTSQEQYTQLSYINNVLAIQEVMRAVRSACPKNRFKFTTANDFTDYADAVNEVLENFKNNFDSLTFTYLEDPTKESQKIYYAAIEFTFNNWAQSEIFDLYALNDTEIVEE